MMRSSVAMKGRFMAGKYTLLENYLRGLPKSQREITLRFQQIEEILKTLLPSSAYEDRRWWDHETEAPPPSLRDTSPKCRRARNLGEEKVKCS
jgi:hypothetical protein